MEARKCCSCGSEEDVRRVWIMPPGHRVNQSDSAKAYVCKKCIDKGIDVNPWWDEEIFVEYSEDALENSVPGDCIHIKSVSQIAKNLKELLTFARKAFEYRVEFVIDEEKIDTRKADGGLFKDLLAAVDVYDENFFYGNNMTLYPKR